MKVLIIAMARLREVNVLNINCKFQELSKYMPLLVALGKMTESGSSKKIPRQIGLHN